MTDRKRDAMSDPGAWIGREVRHDNSWIYHPDANAAEEIDAARAERMECADGLFRRRRSRQ